jgi:hypothetical protein
VIVVRHSSLNISDNYTLQNEEEFEDTKGGNDSNNPITRHRFHSLMVLVLPLSDWIALI